ncbi:hypothetical protein BKA56DRAFT_600206 [Ilyonectria sp. MPI-CAGE-AT-0026]|nr:hypothetical protein BKA56DRAFT_600206 [Ilyonectria sp. MPI-CAGE-AT-0026]
MADIRLDDIVVGTRVMQCDLGRSSGMDRSGRQRFQGFFKIRLAHSCPLCAQRMSGSPVESHPSYWRGSRDTLGTVDRAYQIVSFKPRMTMYLQCQAATDPTIRSYFHEQDECRMIR